MLQEIPEDVLKLQSLKVLDVTNNPLKGTTCVPLFPLFHLELLSQTARTRLCFSCTAKHSSLSDWCRRSQACG